MYAESQHLDAVVVGAGFSGISALYRLRKQGLSAKVFETGDDLGGVWQYNRYPGVRVDSELPFYQLSIPELYNTWDWTCRFPDGAEIRRYMEHVEKILHIKKDVYFEAPVISSVYDNNDGLWRIKSAKGHMVTCKYLLLCTGILSRVNRPDFAGLGSYKGAVYHAALWPKGFDPRAKKLAIIGAGATGIQLVQELSKQAAKLDVYMRNTSYCLPIKQKSIDENAQAFFRVFYPMIFKEARKSSTGFATAPQPCGVFDVGAEEREALFEELWEKGGFHFLSENYNDFLIDPKANKVVYEFWAKKTRARISTAYKRELLAPLEPAFYFGTKRSPLENDFYDCIDRDNVELINLLQTPIQSFTEKGIVTDDGKERQYDAVIFATGFDAFTGALNQMGLKSRYGVDIKDAWADGIKTYLGLTIPEFPNAFIIYGPQAPSTLSNGPTLIESQADLAIEIIKKAEAEKVKSVEPTHNAVQEWKSIIENTTNSTLLALTRSWWTNSNIPGKKSEFLTFIGGIQLYEDLSREKIAGWKGFDIVYSVGTATNRDGPILYNKAASTPRYIEALSES